MTQWQVIQTLYILILLVLWEMHTLYHLLSCMFIKESFCSIGHCLVEWLDNFHRIMFCVLQRKMLSDSGTIIWKLSDKDSFWKLGMKLIILKVCAEQCDTKTCAAGSDKIRDRSLLFGVEYKSSVVKKLFDAIWIVAIVNLWLFSMNAWCDTDMHATY